MALLEFVSDEHGMHVSVPNKHLLFYILGTAVVILLISGFLLYTYYKLNIYDSSLSKIEIKDLTPAPPPPDIQNQIQQLHRQAMVQQIVTPTLAMKNPTASSSATVSAMPQFATISATVRVPIFTYNFVENLSNPNNKTRNLLNTTPALLDAQIQTLLARKYNFITARNFADVLDGKVNLPPNPIMLTFDDGYRDFFTDAYPILKKYNVKATVYVISGFVDKSNHLTTPQLLQIALDGLVEIGSHTVHNTPLSGLSLKTASDEIFQSRVMLEQMINRPVVSFSYPIGSFDDMTIRIVKDAGYRTAVSTLPGYDHSQIDRFFLFRVRPGDRYSQTLIDWLYQSLYDSL